MTTDIEPTEFDGGTLARLIEGEQKLLELFDARQATTDAKLAAALTGALALPAVTLGVAEQLSSQETTFKVGYGAVMALVIIVCVLRMWGGWWLRLRSQKSAERKSTKPTRKWTISTESRDAALARNAWWKCGPEACEIAVHRAALDLWRTRAQHSRRVAQHKDRVLVVAVVAFVVALVITAVIVTQAEF